MIDRTVHDTRSDNNDTSLRLSTHIMQAYSSRRCSSVVNGSDQNRVVSARNEYRPLELCGIGNV